MIAINTIGGGQLGFDALLYKPPTEQVSNYIQSNIARASEALGTAGTSFINNIKNTYDKFNNQSIINMGKSILYGAGSHMNDNVVVPLTVNNLQYANHAMQQYIIANPIVNQMVYDNMCNGFQETYYDVETDVYGEERDDYRRAMDGMVYEGDDGGLYMTQYTSSSDELVELCNMDKFGIMETWDSVQKAIAEGIDPTSPDGEEL